MTVQLRAPYPGVETITNLPNPELTDVQQLKQEISVRRSMSNFVRTYIKTKPGSRITHNHLLTRQKALELQAFIKAYFNRELVMVDHNNVMWLVVFMNNPFEQTSISRHASAPGLEAVSVTLQYEGEEI